MRVSEDPDVAFTQILDIFSCDDVSLVAAPTGCSAVMVWLVAPLKGRRMIRHHQNSLFGVVELADFRHL